MSDGTKAVKGRVWRDLIRNAARRGISVHLTKEQAYELFDQPCHYCGYRQERTRAERTGYCASIDRKDNDGNYTEANVLAACIYCQQAKSDRTYGKFMAYIDRITAHNLRKVLDKIRQTGDDSQ